jgi:hypothetical protein
MNLTCFWSRRACSRYAVLDEPIPPGSKLLTHIEKCDECREYWRSLSLLTTDLDLMVGVPSPSRQYLEPIWERVKPTKRAPDWGRLTLVGAAACGLFCGWLTWRMAAAPKNEPDNIRIADLKPMPDDGPLLPTVPVEPRSDKVIAQGPNAATNAGYKMSELKWTGTLPRHRRHGPRRHGAPLPQEFAAAPTAAEWRTRGEQLEAMGNPRLANVAYQAAYQEHPTEEAAFDVGRSAEESGDMEQAMNAYAGLLAAADARTRNEKGWTP